jgi:hypothetical protein
VRNGEASLTQFMHWQIHVDILQRSNHGRIDHSQGAAKDDLGQLNQPASVCGLCVHQPVFT